MARVDRHLLKTFYRRVEKFTRQHNRGPTTTEIKNYLGLPRVTLRAIAQTGYIVKRTRTLPNGQIINEWRPALFRPKALLLWWWTILSRTVKRAKERILPGRRNGKRAGAKRHD